jgi:hypothetical protein
MSKKKIFLTVQAFLCVLITAVLVIFTVRTCMEGSAWQAAGHPSDWIFTREKAGRELLAVLPLCCLSALMTIIGLVKGIKDEDAEKPVQHGPLAVQAGFAKQSAAGPEKEERRVLLRRILMAAAIVFIVMGVFNGSMKDVLVKAIRICTECVGLG